MRRSHGAPKIFGSTGRSGHGFALADPLTEAEVTEAESQFGVEFPAEYREFLLNVSAGGAGPHYGLAILSRGGDSRWDWDCTAADPVKPDRLGQPFGGEPAVAAAISALDAHDAVEPNRTDFPAGGYEAARARWIQDDDALFDELVPLPGVVAVAHHGCGYLDWLAMTGPERGSIWTDGHGNGLYLQRTRSADGRPLGFFTWYMAWLEASEAALQRSGQE
ncbi:SMI1/KNR4 family protein [Catenulispora sp. GP43]|uniref:SMI1/KNR4 family protein n=1 Tax=Catenulispora sp. GP43 TaxID=3156263 RepID=UPI00351519E5